MKYNDNMSKILCGISGGVDSAVASLLLKKLGYDVVGAFMVNWDLRDELGKCTSDEDFEYAARVCRILDIPLHKVDFVKEYWTAVFENTLNMYEKGFTPNPDVLCNKYIKFDAFNNYAAKTLNCEFISTGHYARTNFNDMYIKNPQLLHDCKFEAKLLQAEDKFKDQTFFLHQISNNSLKRTLFPLGNLVKSEVRSIAKMNNMDFLNKKKESMGICFIGKRKLKHFFSEYIEEKPGNFLHLETKKILGKHNGIFQSTIGQRSLLSVDKNCYYVADKNISTNNMYVVPELHHPHFYAKSIIINQPHWISGCANAYQEGRLECKFRFMHQAALIPCKLFPLENNNCLVVIKYPLRNLTKGQYAVFYNEHECLGGGQILSIGPSAYETNNVNFVPIDCRQDANTWNNILKEFGDQILPPASYEQIVYTPCS